LQKSGTDSFDSVAFSNARFAASSFVVMEEMSITEAFTQDHHFEQAGFVKLI
jgi:hypothetical protein